MKMKGFERIFVGAYAALSALVILILSILSMSWLHVIGALALILAATGGAAYLIRMALRPEGSPLSSSASVQESTEGSVRVSVRAMETLARRAVEQTDGVLDSRLRIINQEDCVRVEVDIVIGIETHVPVVTALLQRNIKGIVEEFSGIAVREVVVLVTEIRNNAPAVLPAPKEEQTRQVVVVPEKVEHEEKDAPAPAQADAEAPVIDEAEIIVEELSVEATGAAAEEPDGEEAEPTAKE